MKFIPILFSTPMVQAILDGRKTQTRRVVKLRDGSLPDEANMSHSIEFDKDGEMCDGDIDKIMDFSKTYPYWQELKSPYGQVGDVLWVRESFVSGYRCDDGSFNLDECGEYIQFLKYKADGESFDWYDGKSDFPCEKIPWKPSIHMPKAACRIFLKITNVRVERLQDISEEDAIKEGVDNWTFANMASPQIWLDYRDPQSPPLLSAYDSFCSLWDCINGEQSWNDNPWVWVIEFERIEKPENFI